ncbi:pyridoxamine 5'-phosphate oxidase family protein [Nocardia brasiliensis]
MTEESPRSRQQRKTDLLARLDSDIDAWFATGDQAGEPYLTPLSFLWDGDGMIVSTVPSNPTAANFSRNGQVRVAIGLTRDVNIVEATVTPLQKVNISEEVGDAFAKKCGFDPRELKTYSFYRVVPKSIQSWRELDELPGRDIMIDGKWLD